MSVPSMLNLVISASADLCNWLSIDPSDIPASLYDGQKLRSDESTLSWQCHVVIPGKNISDGIVIAVEARSHYTLMLPFHMIPSQKQLEQALLQQWIKEAAYMATRLELIADDDMESMFTQFLQYPITVYWYHNNDPALAEHMAFAAQALYHTLKSYRLDGLDGDETISLGLHINHILEKGQLKTMQRAPHLPYDKFLADVLFRFGKGLAHSRYPGVAERGFPNPYQGTTTITTINSGKVLSMAAFLRSKKGPSRTSR